MQNFNNNNIFILHKESDLKSFRHLLNIDLQNVDLNDKKLSGYHKFPAYKQQFNKTYANLSSHKKAYQSFLSSDKLIKLINNLELPFKLGHNSFSDMSYNEFIKQHTGLKKTKSNKMKDNNNNDGEFGKTDTSGNDTDIPVEMIDIDTCFGDDDNNFNKNLLSNEQVTKANSNIKIDWTPFLPPVKNQLECGSCWAFSSIAVIEALLNKKKFLNSQGNNKYTTGSEKTELKWDKFLKELGGLTFNNVSLSEQYILDCAKFPNQIYNQCSTWGGCDGGSQPDCYEAIKNCGIIPSEQYNIVEDKLPDNCKLSKNIEPIDGIPCKEKEEKICYKGATNYSSIDYVTSIAEEFKNKGCASPYVNDYLRKTKCNDPDKDLVIQAYKVPDSCMNINCKDCYTYVDDYYQIGGSGKDKCRIGDTSDWYKNTELAMIEQLSNSPIATSIYVTPALRFYKSGIYNQYQDPTSCLKVILDGNKNKDLGPVNIIPSEINHGVAIVGYEVLDKNNLSDTVVTFDPSVGPSDFIVPTTSPTVASNPSPTVASTKEPTYDLDTKDQTQLIDELEEIISLNISNYFEKPDVYTFGDDTKKKIRDNLDKQFEFYNNYQKSMADGDKANAFYTIRNSWGKDWGINGNLLIRAGINNLQIAVQSFVCTLTDDTGKNPKCDINTFENSDQNETCM